MTQISLAKALKLKKRLSGRYNQAVSNISKYNSVLEEQKGKVNIHNLLQERESISKSIVELKMALYKGNIDIQMELYVLAEKKGEADFYRSLNTREGIERHDYQNTSVTYVAEITKETADVNVRRLEAEVDVLQEAIDEYNHRTKIEVSQSILDLAS